MSLRGVRSLEKQIKKEERFIFREFMFLKRHHQAIFALLIALGIVFVWRGLWGMIDLLWLPLSPTLSYLSGILMGVVILFLAHHLIKSLAGD